MVEFGGGRAGCGYGIDSAIDCGEGGVELLHGKAGAEVSTLDFFKNLVK